MGVEVTVGVEVAEGVEVGLGVKVGVGEGVAVEVGESTWATSATAVTVCGGSLTGAAIAAGTASTVWLKLQADKTKSKTMRSQYLENFKLAGTTKKYLVIIPPSPRPVYRDTVFQSF